MSRLPDPASLIALAAMLSATAADAAGHPEFQCAAVGVTVAFPERDPFFDGEVRAWARTTIKRYAEGKRDCQDVLVPGYEGYPTKRCAYDDADAGAGVYPALHAQVILLDPSSRQLAAWSIHACRSNGAGDAAMPVCLTKLRTDALKSNGAQFPVVGSIVESYCNSSTRYGQCSDLAKAGSSWIGLPRMRVPCGRATHSGDTPC